MPLAAQPYLEWDRHLLVVQAVENGRLYELRLQVPTASFERQTPLLRTVMNSFALVSTAAAEDAAPGS